MKKLLIPLILMIGWPSVAQQTVEGGPPPAVRMRIEALVQALNEGSAEGWERMAQENFTPAQLERRTPAERKAIFESVHRDFGSVTISKVFRDNPDGPLQISIKGSTGAIGMLLMDLEAQAPFRVEKLGVRIGGPPDGGEKPIVPAPAVNGKMTDEELQKALDAYFTKLTAADSFSGNVLVAKGGKTLFEKSYGFADRANHLTNNADTRFNLGSINKKFTQAAIQQLVARGKLSLTDTVGKLLPDYPQEVTRSATVEQLLHHTAGVANFFGAEFDQTNKDRFRSNANYYEFVRGLKPSFAPGAKNEYCNGCYIVLGAIIEKVSGMPYERYIAENIYKPAGMVASGDLQSDGINMNVAMGYSRVEGNDLHSNILLHGASGSAAGGGYSTAKDLLAFSEALRLGRIPDVEVTSGLGIAGGAPGINAGLEENGPWTVIVLTNLDPPVGEQITQAISRALAN